MNLREYMEKREIWGANRPGGWIFLRHSARFTKMLLRDFDGAFEVKKLGSHTCKVRQCEPEPSAIRAYIKMVNRDSEIWMAEGPDRWASMLVDDVAHWRRRKVHTVQQLKDYLANEARA